MTIVWARFSQHDVRMPLPDAVLATKTDSLGTDVFSAARQRAARAAVFGQPPPLAMKRTAEGGARLAAKTRKGLEDAKLEKKAALKAELAAGWRADIEALSKTVDCLDDIYKARLDESNKNPSDRNALRALVDAVMDYDEKKLQKDTRAGGRAATRLPARAVPGMHAGRRVF